MLSLNQTNAFTGLFIKSPAVFKVSFNKIFIFSEVYQHKILRHVWNDGPPRGKGGSEQEHVNRNRYDIVHK
jgi:hypothetical protein